MIYIVGKLWILALIWHRAIEICRILLAVRILVTRPDCFVRMIRFFVVAVTQFETLKSARGVASFLMSSLLEFL